MVVKKIWLVAALMTAAVFFAACGKSGNSQGETAKDYTNESAELVFYSWGNAPEESFNEMYGDPIRKKFPNLTLKYIQRGKQTVQDVISSGQKIDIYFDSIGNFAMTSILNGLQLDMTELIKKHKLDLGRFESTTVDVMKQMSNGGMYGIPVSNTSLLLYYNKAIFNKFGVPYPKDGMSWDDAFATARKITRVEGGTQYVGIGATLAHPIRMNSLSLPLVDAKTGKAAIHSDGWRKVFETAYIRPFDGVTDEKVRNAKTFPGCLSSLTDTQTLAMCIDLSSNPTVQFKSLSKIDWDMVAIPTYKELPGVGVQLYPTYLSITSLSDDRDASMAVIQFLTSDEYQIVSSKQGVMSGLKDETVRKMLGSDSQFKDKSWKSVYYNKFAPLAYKSVYDYNLEKIYADSGKVMELVRGEIDMNTYFRKVEEEGNAFLKEQGAIK